MPFELSIVTPEGVRYHETVEQVVLPGVEGRFGVLPGHVRYLTPLDIGEAEIHGPEGTLTAAISDGFAEVTQEHVVVLVESCELASQIDVARAEQARERAETALAEARQEGEDRDARLADAALRRAVTRIEVARHAGAGTRH